MKKEDVKAVVGQITNMLYNNVELGNGSEKFEGWCEDGDVFENPTDAQIKIMNTLAPFVDRLTLVIDSFLIECDDY